MTFDSRSGPSRRVVLAGAAALASMPAIPGFLRHAGAAGPAHGLSVFGELKYPADFEKFEYVNADAPTGGRFVMTTPSWAYNQNPRTFNTLNGFVLKGDAPARIDRIFDSLMVRAWDEPDAVYGLLAESAEIADDRKTYVFKLRPEARFHDGSALTADDVAFSLNLLKEKGHPVISQTMRDFEAAEADGPDVAILRFNGNQTPQLPLIVSALPIFSKAYYSENDFEASTLDPPLGSGPYRVGRLDAGRFIEYERVPDYWGRDLPVNVGHHNFDVIRLEFYRDDQIAFEAFKKGEISFREEFSSRRWSTEYNFPAIEDGRVQRNEFPDDSPSGAQGWFLNTRREKFANPLTRKALTFAFDFEWTNQNLFYGLYSRTHSFFEKSEMMATGLPSEAELQLLEPFRETLRPEVFDIPFIPPVSDGSGQDRKRLREATALLKEAGWLRKGTGLVDENDRPFTIEFLNTSPDWERIVAPFIKNLEILGIQANFRLVDPAQYESRVNVFDFDIVGRRFSMSPTPGEEMRQFWSSTAADTDGSYNLSGIADPAVDALLETMIRAENRETMTTAARALDRILRAEHMWIPQWFNAVHRVAHWDEFGWPDMPKYDFPVEALWWQDAEKAAAIGRAG